MEWLKGFSLLIGRILLVLIFIQSGIGKIEHFEGTAQYMASFGMAYTHYFLVGAIFIEIICSLAVVLGYFARSGALLLLIFLVPTTLIFHNIFADKSLMTMIHFMKNVSMFGGLLVLLSTGPGRFSIDYFRRKKG